ncbi:MAG: hypothetical protein KGN79_01650 [Acidobacteriota bacterium]|nr:hypothetical protein [Acidobacteriota bacterium]
MIHGNILFAATYYVDFGSGSDNNSGTSTTSPWQHAPGMQTCANVCKSTTVQAGDSIILKGGVTWPNSSFMWSLPGGSAASPVYIGVDKTWYAGSSWTRPILTAGGVAIGNNYDTMFTVPPYVTVDNFAITGFYWDGTSCSGAPYGDCGIFNAGQRSGQTFENLYIHGWTHAGTDASTSSGVIDIFSFGGNGQNVAHDNVIVGTDVAGDHSVNAFFNGPGTAYNNYIKQVSSGFIVSYGVSFHDNHIEDVGPAYCNEPFPQYAGNCSHENGFEDNGDIGLDFYNNVITNVSAGLAIWIAPNPGYTAYLWNNLIYAVHDNQILDLTAPVYNPTYCSQGASSNNYCKATGSFVLWNNTVQCGDDTTQYDCQAGVGTASGQGSVVTALTMQNNHFIDLTGAAASCATGSGGPTLCVSVTPNTSQTQATANGQGYSSTETYAFSPTSSSGATVGAGTNLTTSATGNLATLASDTTYACTDGNGNQPSCPARAAIGRASAGAWNAGAYQSFAPAPPVNLSNVSQ